MTSIVGRLPAARLPGGAAAYLHADKLRIPRPGIAVLDRPRITGLIDAAVSRPVTLLTGPPGAGKTVAAARWARGKPPGSRPAWLALDAADGDAGRFWQNVVSALVGAGVPAPPAGLEPGGLPRWLTTALGTDSPAVVLVLDDIHLIAGSDALAALAELIRHEPPGLRLLLAGRSAPALARLRLSGDLTEIGAVDLACTSEETTAYFDMLGTPLSPAELADVAERTEGWLAGLRLVALGAAAGPAGSQSLVSDYIEDEVLGPLPGEVRSFLLRTCLTPVVHAGLATELTGEAAATAMLDRLSRSGSLVEAVAPRTGEYRYHPMLREALAGCLRRELPDDEVQELHRRVARWHAARRHLPDAVRAAAEAGDWDLASRVLRSSGPSVMLSPDGATVEAMLAGAPPDRIGTDAALAMALAAARIWQGDADGAVPHLECAQLALDGLAGRDHVRAGLWLSALRVLYRASAAPAGPGWLDQELAQAGQASTAPRGAEHEALGVLWLSLGFAALTEFDLQKARSALLHAGSQLSAGGLLALRERGRCWEAVAAALYGDLAAAARLVASVTDGSHGRDPDLAPVLALAGAAVSLGRDDLDDAASLLDQADLAAMMQRPAGEPSIDLLAGLLRARLAVADGNLAGARGLVRWLGDLAVSPAELADLASPPRPQGVAAVVALLDAEISLAAGERERARATLTDVAGHPGTSDPADAADAAGPVVRAQAAVDQARLLIADEDDKAALKLVEPVLSAPAGACSTIDRIRALLAAAVAHRRLSQTGEAAEVLSQALALAEPEDACGPFLLAGAAVRSALTVLISPSNRCAAFAGKILDRFDGRLARPAASQPAALLTDSEVAVLRFLPSHMTNQEIAESLFLSINTIKTHLSSVYRKLGVANRRQAIAQARRLELLLRTNGYAVPVAMRLELDPRVSTRPARHRVNASPPSTRP